MKVKTIDIKKMILKKLKTANGQAAFVVSFSVVYAHTIFTKTNAVIRKLLPQKCILFQILIL